MSVGHPGSAARVAGFDPYCGESMAYPGGLVGVGARPLKLAHRDRIGGVRERVGEFQVAAGVNQE